MARFNGPSAAASAHAAMMRSKKGGGGCLGSIVTISIVTAGVAYCALHLSLIA